MSKQKRQVTAFEVYVSSLAEKVTEEGVKPSNSVKFAKSLEAMVKTITADLNLQKKLLNHYWKQQFNAKFEMKAIIEQNQGSLF